MNSINVNILFKLVGSAWMICQIRNMLLFCFQDPRCSLGYSTPVVGLRKQSLSTFRACVRQLRGGLRSMSEGFEKFSLHGRPFLLPDPSFRMELMLPPEQIKWLTEQPDTILSHWKVREERHATGYLGGGVNRESTMAFVNKIVHQNLSRRLESFQDAIIQAVSASVDKVFGQDEINWTELKLSNGVQDVICSVVTRVLVGEPLCLDESFRSCFKRLVRTMGITKLIVGQAPKPLKPFFAAIIAIPLWWYRKTALKKLVPVVRQRCLENLGQCKGDESSVKQDLMTRAIGGMANREKAASHEMLAQQLLLVGFAGLSPTASVASSAIVDILGAAPDLDVDEIIREEATSHLRTEQDWNDASVFNKLTFTGSAILESLRRRPTLVKGLTREVVPKGGVKLPDGTIAPQGCWMSVPVHAIHMDERVYEHAGKYDPYRFMRLSDQLSLGPKVSFDDQPSTAFLGFGFGRFSCPGRKYGIQMLKVLLAYLFINYDVELLSPVQEFSVIGDAGLPPIGVRVRVRRRGKTRDQNVAASLSH